MSPLARYKWPIMLAVFGAVFIFFAGASLVGALRISGTQLIVPGATSVPIRQSGDYTLWNETKTFIDGQFKTFSDELPPGTAITIVKEPEGTPVSLRPAGRSNVELGGTRRVSVGKVTFSSPGKYRISVTGLDEKRTLYLSKNRFLKTAVIVAGFGTAGMLLLLAATGSALYVLLRKRA